MLLHSVDCMPASLRSGFNSIPGIFPSRQDQLLRETWVPWCRLGRQNLVDYFKFQFPIDWSLPVLPCLYFEEYEQILKNYY